MFKLIFLLFISSLYSKTIPIGQGQVKYFNIENTQNIKSGSYFICDQKVFFPEVSARFISGYFSASYFESSDIACQLIDQSGDATNISMNFLLKKVKYPREFLKVNKSKVNLSKSDLIRVGNEKENLELVYQFSESTSLIKEPFSYPLKSKITSRYGKQRVFNKNHKTQHLGTDFRAHKGKSIPAANQGRVVFTGNLFYSGNTVIIDHGKGILTLYGHLSEISVEQGQLVRKFHIIGKSGSTGRSTAPHLHWGVIVHGNMIDGETLVQESKKAFYR